MWSADAPAVRRSHAAGGFTLIEAVIVAGIVAFMSIALNYAVRTTQAAESQLETASRATLHGQRLTNEIAKLITASRHLYQAGLVGEGYRAACDLSLFPPSPDARLPLIDDENDLGPDAAEASHTGNFILLVRETAGSPCVADKRQGKRWLIDTYRLIAIYPHVTSRALFPGGPTARDVVIWQSEAFPSLQQIVEILDPAERKSVVTDLVKRYGFDYAWDPRREVGAAFYRIDGKGEVAPDPTIRIDILEDAILSQGPQLVHDNVQLAATDRGRFLRRAVLTADELGGWKPHGLELKVTGSPMARKIWIHAVIEAVQPSTRRASIQTVTTIAEAREY